MGILVSLPENYSPPSGSASAALKVGQTVITTAGNAFAEYLVAPVARVAPLPQGVDPKEGVALSTTAFTAMALINESYKVKKGDWVLVRAASGGVGTLLIQVSVSLLSKIRG